MRHFLFPEQQQNIDSDDLLFFVRRKVTKSSSRNATPKLETEVDVFRKDSRKLPIGDPDVNWEETVYLNMIIHEFTYTLTLAICTRTSPKELQVLKRHSQRVYASPSRRKMNTKGESEEMVSGLDKTYEQRIKLTNTFRLTPTSALWSIISMKSLVIFWCEMERWCVWNWLLVIRMGRCKV